MEKKKLGLSGKSKLELSKTVRGGTVRQSFSHFYLLFYLLRMLAYALNQEKTLI